MTPRSRDIPPEIRVADPRAAYGGTACPCGAAGPCANPNCHVRTGHLPGGAFAPTTERVREALRDALTVFADTEWAREYHDLWNLAAPPVAHDPPEQPRCEEVETWGGYGTTVRCDRPAGHTGQHEALHMDHAWGPPEPPAVRVPQPEEPPAEDSGVGHSPRVSSERTDR